MNPTDQIAPAPTTPPEAENPEQPAMGEVTTGVEPNVAKAAQEVVNQTSAEPMGSVQETPPNIDVTPKPDSEPESEDKGRFGMGVVPDVSPSPQAEANIPGAPGNPNNNMMQAAADAVLNAPQPEAPQASPATPTIEVPAGIAPQPEVTAPAPAPEMISPPPAPTPEAPAVAPTAEQVPPMPPAPEQQTQ